MPIKPAITPGQTHDIQAVGELLGNIRKGQMVLADRVYDADWPRDLVFEQGGWANIAAKDQPQFTDLLLTLALQTAKPH